LGAGKTTFIQGFIKALGIRTRVTSPTFLIFRSYPLTKNLGGSRSVIHADLYRIQKFDELKTLGFKKILDNQKNIVLIEWAEKIKKHLPKKTLWIKLGYGLKENEREIEIMDKS
ncbi:MAG TPA: tRNA (adenosine(37)-N6)-threonylcarbamoyltransferase complex ATPase subunit type 1 TsaE, partial [Candidatus Paceibacterota bacterium]